MPALHLLASIRPLCNNTYVGNKETVHPPIMKRIKTRRLKNLEEWDTKIVVVLVIVFRAFLPTCNHVFPEI